MAIIKYPSSLPLNPGFHTAASILRYPGAPPEGVSTPPSPGDVARAMRYKQVILDYTKTGPLDCEEVNATSKLLADATEYEQKVLAHYTGMGLNSGITRDDDYSFYSSEYPPPWAVIMQQNIESMLSNFQLRLTSAIVDMQTQVNDVQSNVARLEEQISSAQESISAIPNVLYAIDQERERARQEKEVAAQSELADANFRMELENETKQAHLNAISELSQQIGNVQSVLDNVQHATKRAEIRVMNDISIRLDNRAIQPLPNSAGDLYPAGQTPITSTEQLWRLSSQDVDKWIAHYGIPVPSDVGHPVKLTALRTFLGVL